MNVPFPEDHTDRISYGRLLAYVLCLRGGPVDRCGYHR